MLKEDRDVLASCGLGLIYALSALSFRDARPRGYSEMHYEEVDDWKVADLVRHLRYERGRLVFHADYVRGRMMKTTVEIDPEGSVLLETANRGEAATRWVARVQGKRVMALVDEGQSLASVPRYGVKALDSGSCTAVDPFAGRACNARASRTLVAAISTWTAKTLGVPATLLARRPAQRR